jgi:hypothetical protein
MLGMFSKSIAFGSLIAVSFACSQAPAPKAQKVNIKSTHLRDRVTTNTPTRTPANAQLSCDEIWAGFVAANPQGYSKTYQATTTTEYTGGEGLPDPETVTETSKDTVTVSSDASVSITYEYTTSADSAPIPAQTQTLTKVDFLAQCNAPAPAGVDEPTGVPTPAEPAPTVEILEQGAATITVGAGEFETDFVSGKITQTGENAYTALASEWYITGTDFLVKSTFESTSVFDTISVKTTQVVELIELVIPQGAAVVPAA